MSSQLPPRNDEPLEEILWEFVNPWGIYETNDVGMTIYRDFKKYILKKATEKSISLALVEDEDV